MMKNLKNNLKMNLKKNQLMNQLTNRKTTRFPKRFASLLTALVLLSAVLLVFAGPAAGEEAAENPFAQAVLSVLQDAETLTEMPPEDFTDLLGIEEEEFSEALWLIGDGLDGREILAIRAADEASAAHVEEAFTFYLAQRRKETQNYLPAAFQLLSAAEVVRKDLLVLLIVGDHAAEETAALLSGEEK